MSHGPPTTSDAIALAKRLEKAADDVAARATLARLQLDRGQHRAAAALLAAHPKGVDPPASFAVLRRQLANAPAASGPAEIAEDGPSCLTCLSLHGLGLVLFVATCVVGTLHESVPTLERWQARQRRVEDLDSPSFRVRVAAVNWLNAYGSSDQQTMDTLGRPLSPGLCEDEGDALEAIRLLESLEPVRGSAEKGAIFVSGLAHDSQAVQDRSLQALKKGRYRLDPKKWDTLFAYVGAHRNRWAEVIPLLRRRRPNEDDLIARQERIDRLLELVRMAVEGSDRAARIVALRQGKLVKRGSDPEWGETFAKLAMHSGDRSAEKSGTELGLHYGLEEAIERFLEDLRTGQRTASTSWSGTRSLKHHVARLRPLGFEELRTRYEAETHPFTKEVLERALAKAPGGLNYLVSDGTWTPTGKRLVDVERKRKRKRKRKRNARKRR